MSLNRLKNSFGYSLIELVVVIVIIGIIATVSMKTMRNTTEISRVEETKAELELLANAIAGDPNKVSVGGRTDFGYVGDIGALPASLSALVINPGYTTWHGPYIADDFSTDGSSSAYLVDAWGKAYNYSGVSIQSTGGPTTITKQIAPAVTDLLSNTVSITIVDRAFHAPGATYKDSVKAVLSYPDGSGAVTNATHYPDQNGNATFSGVPIGKHTLRVIIIPTADTLIRRITINPGQAVYAEFQHYDEIW